MISFKPVRQIAEIGLGVEIISRSFGTVAKEFNLASENCPANPAFITKEKIIAELERGCEMFIMYSGSSAVGFVAVEQSSGSETTYYIEKVSILPSFRHDDLGKELMHFAEELIRQKGGKEISLGIIEENTRLKKWYKRLGYIEAGTKTFPHLPFTVGFLKKNLY